MALVIETGAGVRDANAYFDNAFVSSYLAARGRSTENGWSTLGSAAKDSFVLDGTDYIEQRWGLLFKGAREFTFSDIRALGSITFAGLPVAAETLTVGDQVYTFVASLTDPAVADEILIGGNADATAANTFNAIAATAADAGVTHGTGTLANRHAGAEVKTTSLSVVSLTAAADGASGNFTGLLGTPTNVTLASFTGGQDGGSQALSFPRVGLADRRGALVFGIPLKLKQAGVEYTIRAASGTSLYQDPTVDPLGGSVTKFKERVGPIETETEYLPGTAGSGGAISYPAADRLLSEYVRAAGTVIRG